jgi:hypothetical protein
MVLGKLTEMGVEAGVTAYTGNPAAGKLAGKVSGNLVILLKRGLMQEEIN